MIDYFALKESMQRDFDFFSRKYGNNTRAATGRTFVECVEGFEGLEYRLRILFLCYTVAIKQLNTTGTIMEESISNLDELSELVNSSGLNDDEKSNLSDVISSISDFAKSQYMNRHIDLL